MSDDDYFSLHEILLGEEKLMVRMEVDAEQLGELDPAHMLDNRTDLERGSTVQLPTWLSLLLARFQFVELKSPDIYSQRIRDALAISADSVAISSKSDFFWEVGMFIGGLMNDLQLSETLKDSLMSRISLLVQRSSIQTNLRDNFAFFEATLGAMERQYIEKTRRAAKEFSLWKSGQSHVVECADIIDRAGDGDRAKRIRYS